MTYTKYHFKPSGFSDYCPTQLAYTDDIPTFNPSYTTFTTVKVERDNPDGGGTGASANQFSVPVVESTARSTLPTSRKAATTAATTNS